MPRYKLTIAYDGTDFCGWQKQEPPAGLVAAEKVTGAATSFAETVNGDGERGPSEEARVSPDGRSRVILRTVQEVAERAVREVVREPIILMGASRTDAGVHACGQVAAFTCSDPPNPPAPPPTSGARSNEPSAQAEDRPPPSPVLAHGARTGWPLSRGTDKLILALNSRLPEDVLITAAEPVADSFNPIS